MKNAYAHVSGVLILGAILATASHSQGQTAANVVVPGANLMVPSNTAETARMQWWRDAKFGLFIHWGLYSILGRGEWVEWNDQIPVDKYAELANKFNADKFDPSDWAAIAKSAGMGYVIMTSRHHDGFALFNDPESNFTSMTSAAHRDLVAEYVKAIRKAGLHVGLYYSPLDWRYPGFFFPGIYQSSAEAMRDQYHRQLNELARNYGKLDVLWFDGGGEVWLGFGGVNFKNGKWGAREKGKPYVGSFMWQDDQAVANLRKLQPSIIINNRTDAPADFRSRESDKNLGDFDNRAPWELATTLTEGAWGYQPSAKLKSRDYIIRLLVNTVGRDGNLLLNVGPRPDGGIDPTYADRLREVGDWLRKNGDSIYRTRGGPYLPGDFGVSTYRGNKVYLHILNLADKTIILPGLPEKLVNCSLMTTGDVACKQEQNHIEIILGGTLDPVDTIVIMTLASSTSADKPVETPITTKPFVANLTKP